MNDLTLRQKQLVIKFIENYYTAPPCSRKLLLDNIILGIKCMSTAQTETEEQTAESEQNVSNSDLISRKVAIDALEKEKPTPFVNKDGSIDSFGAGRQNQWYRDGITIMNLPPAQPEMPEIIRCKNCKHRPDGDGFNHRISFPDDICPCQCSDDEWYSWVPKDDWFCPNGERWEE